MFTQLHNCPANKITSATASKQIFLVHIVSASLSFSAVEKKLLPCHFLLPEAKSYPGEKKRFSFALSSFYYFGFTSLFMILLSVCAKKVVLFFHFCSFNSVKNHWRHTGGLCGTLHWQRFDKMFQFFSVVSQITNSLHFSVLSK